MNIYGKILKESNTSIYYSLKKAIQEGFKKYATKKIDAIMHLSIDKEGNKFTVELSTLRHGLEDKIDSIGKYVESEVPELTYNGFEDTRFTETDFGTSVNLEFTLKEEK